MSEELSDGQAARAAALQEAAAAFQESSVYMTTSSAEHRPERKVDPKSISGIFRKAWDGSTEAPGLTQEDHHNHYGDYVLRAAEWIVSGTDSEEEEVFEDE